MYQNEILGTQNEALRRRTEAFIVLTSQPGNGGVRANRPEVVTRPSTTGVTSHPGTSQCGGCETNSNASSGIGPRLASCSPLKELFTADELN